MDRAIIIICDIQNVIGRANAICDANMLWVARMRYARAFVMGRANAICEYATGRAEAICDMRIRYGPRECECDTRIGYAL